jgi:hypothetical protein
MLSSFWQFCKRLRVGRLGWAVVIAALLGLPGCARWDLRGQGFKEDELSGMCRQMRPREKSEPFGISNKSVQIEKDLGVGN